MVRSRNIEGSKTQELTLLDNTSMQKLKHHYVLIFTDFQLPRKPNIDAILGNDPAIFMAKIQLRKFAKYLEEGGPAPTSTTTWNSIATYVKP